MADSTDLIQQIIKTSEFKPGRLCLQSAGLAFVQRSEKIDETGSDLESKPRITSLAGISCIFGSAMILIIKNSVLINKFAIPEVFQSG